jgi:hypothetical protein
MSKNKLSVISFEKFTGAEHQGDVLYELLKKRKHNISHKSNPTKYEHNKFINNHPYRAWYLILKNNKYIGSTYVLKNNCISINFINEDFEILSSVLKFIFKHYKPLKEIKSERPPNFYINVPPNNKKIRFELNKIGAKKIQITYALDFDL